MDIFLILLLDLLVAIYFGKLAEKKGYPGISWGILGFIFPILYLILLLLPYQNISKVKNKINKKEKQNFLIKHKDISLFIINTIIFILLFFILIFIMLIISNNV